MPGSLKIGSILGITIRVHVLLVLLGALLLWDEGPAGVLVFAILFGVVLLHELGHSIVAQILGVRVVDITLWPLGGVARMSAMPESGRIEGLIAIAGPALNFALAAVGFLATLLLSGGGLPGFERALDWFVRFNLLLGTFNLIPAFPMDGGRILRAFLASRSHWLAATERAVRVGGAVSFLFAIAGCVLVFSSPEFLGLGLALILVGAFLWWTGRQELAAVRQRHGVHPFAALAELLRRSMEGRAAAGDRSNARPEARAPESRAEGLSPRALEELEGYRGSLQSWRERQDA